MGRGGDDLQGQPRVKRDGLSFIAPKKKLTRPQLQKINQGFIDKLEDLERQELELYYTWIEERKRLKSFLRLWAGKHRASNMYKETQSETFLEEQKNIDQEIEQERDWFESITGDKLNEKTIDRVKKIITTKKDSSGRIKEMLRAEARDSVKDHISSKKGVWMEDNAFLIAQYNPKIRVPEPAIAGPGASRSDIENKSPEQRKIYHRIVKEDLDEVTNLFYKKLTKIKASGRDSAGAVKEEVFEEIRKEMAAELKKRFGKRQSEKLIESPYDLLLERNKTLSVWEIKSSGHIASKQVSGEYKQLLKNTLLLSLTSPGKKVQPFFALGTYKSQETLISNRDIPSGHILTADLFWNSLLPEHLSWEDDYIITWAPKAKEEQQEFLLDRLSEADEFFEKKIYSSKYDLRLGKGGDNFFNAFWPERSTSRRAGYLS